jgi:hypothetical protein
LEKFCLLPLYQVFVATKLFLLKLYFAILNFKTMKNKIFSFKPFMILLIVLSFCTFACQQDLLNTPEPQVTKGATTKAADKAAIADAKQWFDKNYERLTSPSSPIKPVWGEAFILNNTIEVPFFTNDKKLKPSIGSEKGKLNLILSKKSINDYKVFCMGYAPSKEFVGTVENINIANYKHQKFDGLVMVANLDFRAFGAYTFKNGKSTEFTKLNKQDANTARPRNCSYQMVLLGCGQTTFMDANGVFTVSYECIYDEVYTCTYDDPSGGCPNANDPLCDDDGGGTIECPAMPWCDDPGTGGNNNNNSTQDYVLFKDNEYVYSSNLSFSAIDENGSIKQQAAISGIYAKLEYNVNGSPQYLNVSLPTLYFAADFHTSSGYLLLSHELAASTAANAINSGENRMRQAFKSGTRDASQLRQIWYDWIGGQCDAQSLFSIDVSQNRIISEHTPNTRLYNPCN